MSSESVASGPDYQRVVELIRKGSSPLVFTCEHGGQQDFWLRPTLFRNQAARLTGTHWAFDPGAAELTRDLCARTRSRGIVCHVTRLFCDVNRPPGSETLARRFCDEVEIEENRDMLDEKERRMRIEKVWVPFHVRAAALANEFDTKIASVIAGMEIQSTMKLTTCIIKKKIASIHSFNPVYEGSTRDHVQIGILSSFDDSVALKVIDQLRKDGFTKVIHNEPWSGKKGLSKFSVDQTDQGEDP